MSATIAVNEDGGSLTIPTQTSSMGSTQQTSFGGIFRRKASDSHHRTSQIPRVLTFVHLLPVGELPSIGNCQYWLGFQGFISARAQICIGVAEGPAPGRACVGPQSGEATSFFTSAPLHNNSFGQHRMLGVSVGAALALHKLLIFRVCSDALLLLFPCLLSFKAPLSHCPTCAGVSNLELASHCAPLFGVPRSQHFPSIAPVTTS
jgi:hypothetical protein